MKKTILYDKHLALNAKMSPFGGYLMPIQYEGIIKEHNAARNNAAIFDTCHMGEFLIRGPQVIQDLEHLLSCPVANLKIGQCRYGFLCNEQGGVIDDQIVYRLGELEFFMVVNAATEGDDFQWITTHLSIDTTIVNLTESTGKIDLQGPASPRIFQKLMSEPVGDMKYYHFKHNTCMGERVLTSRTGYTGEIGFEIYCSTKQAPQIWDTCISLGAVPAGLGARDTLRLEMGFPLYGHELDQKTNAAESCFSRAIGSKSFIGSDFVHDTSRKKRSLCGIIVEGRRAARQGDTIISPECETIGVVTSGSFSPSIQCALALGYIENRFAAKGSAVRIRTERGELSGKISDLPFYKKASGRDDLAKHL